MPEIAVDARMIRASGIGSYLRHILPLLVSIKPDFTWHILGDTNDLQSESWAESDNIRLIDCRSRVYSIAEQYALPGKIPRCDLLFSPHYVVPLPYRSPMLVTIHDVFHLAEENQDKTMFRSAYARLMMSSALNKAKRVMTDSRFTKDEMIKYNLPHTEKVRVVYLGVDLPEHRADHVDGRYLLYVGNVKPHKNIRRMIDAYKRLHEKRNIPLKIVGEADKFITGIPGLREEVTDSAWGKWIEFTGWIEDDELVKCYREAAALILPSLYEGFGLPPLEAMTQGCPCLVSRAGSLPEICGDAALYCNPYDISDIADKMHRILVDTELRNKLITLGYQRARRYDWRSTVDAVLSIMEEILADADCLRP
ncbi:MAG: glycosyltransferase family 4 protein [candidate division Zixibacteria bacterium]|nr:glycosyltransferase family 4 protein [candidate division Zixibacteria bacterium]